MKLFKMEERVRALDNTARFLNELVQMFDKAEERLSGRSFCITKSGYIGWYTESTREGDRICIFQGSRFPFVVRESGGILSGKYRLREIAMFMD